METFCVQKFGRKARLDEKHGGERVKAIYKSHCPAALFSHETNARWTLRSGHTNPGASVLKVEGWEFGEISNCDKRVL